MQGIKPHTHEDRNDVIDKILPTLLDTFGDNLIALGADGSFARNEDVTYSDLELVAFFKEVPKDWKYRKVIDGMLTVIVAETKASYIEKYLDVSDVWYASGAGKLYPLMNDSFIEEINFFEPKEKEGKCLLQIQNRWPFFQEISAKVLNICLQQDTEAMVLVLSSMVKELLITLSFLNTTPYKTLGSYIEQAKDFPLKPKGFEKLLELFVDGEFQQFDLIKTATEEVFTSLEEMISNKGVELYNYK